MEDALLDGLTDEQRLAVTTPHHPLCIIAGAGTGKTRVLTRRIAYQATIGEIDPTRTLAVTFTRKAARELGHRLRRLGVGDGVTSGTFHALAYAQLRARWADQGIRPPELLEWPGRWIARLLPADVPAATRSAISTELSWAAAHRLRPEAYPAAAAGAGRTPPVPPAQIVRIAEEYRREKRRRRMVDFDDLLELCVRDLADPAFADTRHWRYRHLFVDEFQDVNPLQFALLRAWLGADCTLAVVGDPDQAIYGWNGADPDLIRRFDHHFPGAQVVRLTRNFRSTPQILAAAAGALGTGRALVATRPDGPPPRIVRCPDETAEAAAVARRVRDRHQPQGRWRRQAVLVRTNAQTAPIAQALRRAGIPVAVRAGSGLLQVPAVRDLLREIRHANQTVHGLLVDLRTEAGHAADPETVENLTVLAGLAEEYQTLFPAAAAADFVPWLRATLFAESAGSGADAVDVLTFHAAKGLEWPIVHLAGVEAGLVPHALATTVDAADEERRLFHVAITRAQEELHVSWAEHRSAGDRRIQRRPSPFLRDLVDHLGLVTSRTDPVEIRLDHARRVRTELDARRAPDRRDALVAWRAGAARAAGAAPRAVLDDAAIDRLCADPPDDTEALAAIIGPIRAARHGAHLLALLRETANTGPHVAASDGRPAASTRKE